MLRSPLPVLSASSPSPSSASLLSHTLPFTAIDDDGTGEVEWPSSPSLARLAALDAADAQCDDSSDDSDGEEAAADGSAEVVEVELEDDVAMVSALCEWNGLKAEEVHSCSRIEVFQQHQFRRIHGLSAFKAVRSVELLHQSHRLPFPFT